MSQQQQEAIACLTAAFRVLDAAKDAHTETTANLKDAKEQVELCARAVCEAQDNPQASLFDGPAPTTTALWPARPPTEPMLPGGVSENSVEPEPVLNGETGALVGSDVPFTQYERYLKATEDPKPALRRAGRKVRA